MKTLIKMSEEKHALIMLVSETGISMQTETVDTE